MKIDICKLDLTLARNCMVSADLRPAVSGYTLTRIRRGEEVKSKTVGRIARALDVDVTEIIKED